MICFNPCRVFSLVAILRSYSLPVKSVCFNPCRVFSLVAIFSYTTGRHQMLWVSIPVGFSASLRFYKRGCRGAECFQVSIPVGFSASLRFMSSGAGSSYFIGFNPCRVFSLVAMLLCPNNRNRRIHVSIPVGFSASLRYCQARLLPVMLIMFQSLSGFQPRCDLEPEFQHCSSQLVSIPVGFSASLRSKISALPSIKHVCFNPCRVFSLVAI